MEVGVVVVPVVVASTVTVTELDPVVAAWALEQCKTPESLRVFPSCFNQFGPSSSTVLHERLF